MGSPFYSAPDDIEMTELLGEQSGQAPPTPSLNMDRTPQRAPMLPILEEEEWLHADVLEDCQIFKITRMITGLLSTLELLCVPEKSHDHSYKNHKQAFSQMSASGIFLFFQKKKKIYTAALCAFGKIQISALKYMSFICFTCLNFENVLVVYFLNTSEIGPLIPQRTSDSV